MRCPVCSAEHDAGTETCPTTGLEVPASLEAVLALRRLSPNEVLRLGLQVCDRWRRHGITLADIRPRNLGLGFDGAATFTTSTPDEREPEFVGLRALGGVLARALDRSSAGAPDVAGFLQDLAGCSTDARVAGVRAEIHQRLAGGPDADPLDARTLADDELGSELAPTVGLSAVTSGAVGRPAQQTGPTQVPIAIGPSSGPEADPFADTYIRSRAELFADASTDPTLHVSTVTLDDPMSSVKAGIPGPGAEPLPSEVRPRPTDPGPGPASRPPVLTVALAVFGVAVVVAIAILGLA